VITIRIDWQHETFESGLETWTTAFRGFFIEVRKNPGDEENFLTTITAGHDPLWEKMEPSPKTAMTNSLKWANQYWDLLEDGPVTYEAMDVAPHLSQQPEELPDRDGLPAFKDVKDIKEVNDSKKRLPPERAAEMMEDDDPGGHA
jgi:hypothetical protein